jgi:hypothetical protein
VLGPARVIGSPARLGASTAVARVFSVPERRARCPYVKIFAARAHLGFRSGLVCFSLVSAASTCAASAGFSVLLSFDWC